jgi:hypothetical protein
VVEALAGKGSVTMSRFIRSLLRPLTVLGLAVAGLSSLAGVAHADPSVLRANEYLFPGQGLFGSCFYGTTMQSDGNLATYSRQAAALWATNTVGRGGYLVMQADGNLVMYNWADMAVWSTRTSGNAGATTVQQDDGNLVVYKGGRAVWASGVVGEPLGDTNGCSGSPTKTAVAVGQNRPGSDIRSIELSQARASWCGYYCAQDARCRAWTYVPPGVQAAGAMCWLKGAVPAAVPAAGMTSGVIQ